MRPIGDHFYTTSAFERDSAVLQFGYVEEGIACWVVAPTTVPLYRLLNTTTGDHFYTTSLPERDNAIANFGYVNEGVACWVPTGAVAGQRPLYRLRSLNTGDHFYTTSLPERDNAIIQFGYTDEGFACEVFETAIPGTTPLFRLLNPSNGDHFYTTSATERDNAITQFGYTDEGVACHVFVAADLGTDAFYRLLNTTTGDHFYTTSATERDNAITQFGYTSEGVACAVFETAIPGTTPLFRLLNPSNGDHFYTTSATERDNAITQFGYTDEGVSCHVFGTQQAGTAPFHRVLKRYGARVRLRLKVLQNPTISIATMITSMQQVYDEVGLRVEIGSTENLNLPNLLDPNVGQCIPGSPTADQNQLFSNRNDVEMNDVTIYFVRTTVPAFNGCAVFPTGEEGAIVASGASRWTLGHEVGHVLGLQHIAGENGIQGQMCSTPDFTRLMTGCGTANITKIPPDLVGSEAQTMYASPLSVNI